MPDSIAVILLGIIEGITEFLPISSTGHLLIAEHWIPEQSEMFNVVIQCGAVLAVLAVFAKRLRQLVSELDKPATRDYFIKLAAAFVLTGIGGLVLKKAGFTLPKTLPPIAWATLIGGVLILAIEFFVAANPDPNMSLGRSRYCRRRPTPGSRLPRHFAVGCNHFVCDAIGPEPRESDGIFLPARHSHDVRGRRLRDSS